MYLPPFCAMCWLNVTRAGVKASGVGKLAGSASACNPIPLVLSRAHCHCCKLLPARNALCLPIPPLPYTACCNSLNSRLLCRPSRRRLGRASPSVPLSGLPPLCILHPNCFVCLQSALLRDALQFVTHSYPASHAIEPHAHCLCPCTDTSTCHTAAS